MNRLKKQIDYAKFTENSIVTLDIDYAERLLLELTEQYESPTLEEVKKEWNNAGWDYKNIDEYVLLINKKDKEKRIIINDVLKRYFVAKGYITLQEHQLLTKTFKALGWL